MSRFLFGLVCLFVTGWGAFGSARAEGPLQLPPLFTDNMVLPAVPRLTVSGKNASPGAVVTAKINGASFASEPAGPGGDWSLELKKLQEWKSPKDQGPFTLSFACDGKETVLKNVLIGQVWVCSGQSNMQWTVNSSSDADKVKAESRNEKIRLFTVPMRPSVTPDATLKGSWVECDPRSVGGFSAVGYHFGKKFQAETGSPVGLINCSWGGTYAEAWTPEGDLLASPTLETIVPDYKKRIPDSINKYKRDLENWKKASAKAKDEGKTPPRAPQNPETSPNRPSVLFQGMVTPLLHFPIQGVIWYQGEANAGNAYTYRTLFPVMIQSWRKAWNNPELPFLFVQLAPFMAISKTPQESAWAELREAQLLTSLRLPRTGMAVITDVGDEKDIHPKQKQPVGERLAAWALFLESGGSKGATPCGPVYKSVKFESSKAILEFNHPGKGLECRGDTLVGFTIAGPDKKFVNAQARIEGDRVIVWADGISQPVAVRYGWANYPVVNLWNKDGFPATPFRTDDFKGVTGPR